MSLFRRLVGIYGIVGIMVLAMSSLAIAQSEYPYYGGPSNPPSQESAPPSQQPPVIYQPVPVYRPVYRAPAWASPTAAALGPWKWNLDVGGGPTIVTGSNNPLRNGGNFQFGAGYNFTPRTGLVFEFTDSWLDVTNSALDQNNAINGDGYVWSFTLNPIWRFRIGGPFGGYLIGGGGYYRRELRFEQPVDVLVQDEFGNTGVLTGTQVVRQYDDAGGLDIGGGLTWNLGWGTKLFVEARYHHIFTPGQSTQLIPVTIGLRW